MKNLIILTSSFPFEGGEQFIESEISYWEKTEFDNIILLPYSCVGKQRATPENIQIIKQKVTRWDKLYFLLVSIFSIIFWKECSNLYKNKELFLLKKIVIALKLTANTLLQRSRIAKVIRTSPKDDWYIYSYWNDVTAYGAILLKNQGLVRKVFSRVHGFDIYEERRALKYMPLKRQFVSGMDLIFCLSESAKFYYQEKYNADLSQLRVARLGVKISDKCFNYQFEPNSISLVSLSYCAPVKRIDKLVQATLQLAKERKDWKVKWIHIGDGPLFGELLQLSKVAMQKADNLEICFLGSKSNQEVQEILKNGHFDLFVNCSESEGIPVSIMEAMSYGIPAIAPDVGGIKDLVKQSNGYLLSSQLMYPNP